MTNWKNRIVEYGVKPADQFAANPMNPRRHPQAQRDAVKASLDTVGWIGVAIENKQTGYLIDGHERVMQALERNEDVPYILVDLTPDEEALALASFDWITQMAVYDREALDSLLRDVNTDDAVLQNLLSELATEQGLYLDPPPAADDPGAQVDRAEELLQKWGVARGDVWQIGKHRLMCGDSTSAEDVARLMAGERAALAWFDPPFGIDLQPQRGLTDAIANDGNMDARKLWGDFLPLLHEYLQDPANVFLCQGWTEFEWTLPLIRQYFTLKSKVVWAKNVWGIGYYTRPQHEDVIYCWKGKPPTLDEPVSDVWEVARESAPDHAAEKPPELSGMAIQHFCKRGDVVIDWFGGVGGSMVASEQHGRLARLIELEPKYCAVILERMGGMGLTPVKIS